MASGEYKVKGEAQAAVVGGHAGHLMRWLVWRFHTGTSSTSHERCLDVCTSLAFLASWYSFLF